MRFSLFLSIVLGTGLDEVLLCPGDGPHYYTPDEDFIAGNSMTIQFVSDDTVTAPGAVIRLQLGMFNLQTWCLIVMLTNTLLSNDKVGLKNLSQTVWSIVYSSNFNR